MDVNIVAISGNLSTDVELHRDSLGTAVAHFTIGVNRRYRPNRGICIQEEHCFVRIVAFGKIAELCQQYLKKGAGCFIKGCLKQEATENKQGKREQHTRVCVEDIKFLNKNEQKNEPNGNC